MEEWRDIPGFNGTYRVSVDGRVMSCRRDVPRLTRTGRRGVTSLRERILKPLGATRTYVGLYKDGVVERIPTRILVEWAFGVQR